MAPKWLFNMAAKVFNVGVVDQSANRYFENLADNILEARKKESATTHDFLQTLADNMVERTNSNYEVDDNGNTWTREGKIYVQF